jgi:hypothetical protein
VSGFFVKFPSSSWERAQVHLRFPCLILFCFPTLKMSEPEFLNFYGAEESLPRNQFHQPMLPGSEVRQPYSSSVPSPIDCLKIPALNDIITIGKRIAPDCSILLSGNNLDTQTVMAPERMTRISPSLKYFSKNKTF